MSSWNCTARELIQGRSNSGLLKAVFVGGDVTVFKYPQRQILNSVFYSSHIVLLIQLSLAYSDQFSGVPTKVVKLHYLTEVLLFVITL